MMVVEDVWLELNVLFPAPAHALVQIQDQILGPVIEIYTNNHMRPVLRSWVCNLSLWFIVRISETVAYADLRVIAGMALTFENLNNLLFGVRAKWDGFKV